MHLLIVTLDDPEEFLRTLSSLKDHGMNGIVLPSTSLKHALLNQGIEDAPIFGKISAFVKTDFQMSHTLLMLIPTEKLEEAKEAVHKIVNSLGKKKGVMFALPVDFWEGIDA